MREVIVENEDDTVSLSDIFHDTMVFAGDDDGQIGGMIVKERNGYITRKPDGTGSSGHHETIHDCIRSDSRFWTFYVN